MRLFILAGLGLILGGAAQAEVPCEYSEHASEDAGGNWDVCTAKTPDGTVRVFRGNPTSAEFIESVELAGASDNAIPRQTIVSSTRIERQVEIVYLPPRTTFLARWVGRPDRLRCDRFTCRSPDWF